MRKILLILLLLLPISTFAQLKVQIDVENKMIGANPMSMSYAPRVGGVVALDTAGSLIAGANTNRLYYSQNYGDTWIYDYTGFPTWDPHAHWFLDSDDHLFVSVRAGSNFATDSVVMHKISIGVSDFVQDDYQDGSVWDAVAADSVTVIAACPDKNSDMVLVTTRSSFTDDAYRHGKFWYSTDNGATFNPGDTVRAHNFTTDCRVAMMSANNTIYYFHWRATEGVDIYEWNGDTPPTFTMFADGLLAGTIDRGFSYTVINDTLMFVGGIDSGTVSNIEIYMTLNHVDSSSTSWTTPVSTVVTQGGAGAPVLIDFGLTTMDLSDRVIARFTTFKPGTIANWADSTEISIMQFDLGDSTWATETLTKISQGYQCFYGNAGSGAPKIIPDTHEDRMYVAYSSRGGDAADTDPDAWLAVIQFTDIIDTKITGDIKIKGGIGIW